MLTKRVYGMITNNNDLRILEQEASENGGHAVGITRPGTLYKLDPTVNKAVVITTEEAAQILELDIAEIEAYVAKRGHYELPQIVIAEPEPEPQQDPTPEPEPVVVVEETVAEPVVEAVEPEPAECYDEAPYVDDEEPEMDGPRQALAKVNDKLDHLTDTADDADGVLVDILSELQSIHLLLIQIDSKLLD